MDNQLVVILQQAQKELEEQYRQALLINNKEQATILQAKIRGIIQAIQQEYDTWASIAVAQSYVGGYLMVEYTNGVLKKIDPDVMSWSLEKLNEQIALFASPHKEAITTLIDGTSSVVSASFEGLEKRYNFIVGETLTTKIRERIAIDMATGAGAGKTKKSITTLLENMDVSIRDSAGRKWDLGRYAEMLVRTERARAQNTAIVNRGVEMWFTKFKVIEKSTCCDICAEHDGKTYDIMDGAIDLPPYHPNCQWTLETLIE